MNDVASGMGRRSTLYRWFVSVKYLTYILLSFNVYLFLEEELVSAAHSGLANFELASLIQLFSATLDTAAWVLLLLLFELETAVIPDDRLRGITKWSIHGVRLGVQRGNCFGVSRVRWVSGKGVFALRKLVRPLPVSWSATGGQCSSILTPLFPSIAATARSWVPDTLQVYGT